MKSSQDDFALGQAALTVGDWHSARNHFEAFLQEHDSPEAHDGLGIALWWLNQIQESHEQRIRAYLGFKEQGELGRAARIAAWLGREQVFLNNNDSAMKGWFARAERLLNQTPGSVENGWFIIQRASMIDTPTLLEKAAAEVVEIAYTFRDSDLEAFALAFSGMARVALGRIEDGMAHLDEAMTAATGGEVRNFMVISEIFCVMLSACELAGDLVRCEQWCKTAASYAERHHCSFLSAYCRATYGGLMTLTGRWQEAEAELTEAIRAFEAGHRGLRIPAVLRLADLRVSQGRLEEADILLTGYEDQSAALVPLARLYMARGENERARAMLEQALVTSPSPSLNHMPILLLQVEVLLTIGNTASAHQTVEKLMALAQHTRSDLLIAQAELARGRVKRQTGESDAAVCFQSVINRLAGYDQSLLASHAHLEMARTLKDTDRAGAVTQAQAALASFERIGATHDADEATHFLRELGIARRTIRRQELLTGRESEVLALIAQGLTNRAIADRLVISPKTVEHHVSQILSKLGLRSRAEAAAFAASQSP